MFFVGPFIFFLVRKGRVPTPRLGFTVPAPLCWIIALVFKQASLCFIAVYQLMRVHFVLRVFRVSLCLRQSSYVYVFDGLPRFLGNGVVHPDSNLIGAFCGTTRTQPVTVEATSGNRLSGNPKAPLYP